MTRREVIKVGLVYVCPGQQDEKGIFMNDATATSGAYKEFVQGLAANVYRPGNYF